MKRLWVLICVLFTLTQCKNTIPQPKVTLTIDPSVRYQTILGWGACTPEVKVPIPLRDQIVDVAVNLLGLTRLRYEPPSGNRSNMRRWEWLNDDDDPTHINWRAFETKALDERVSFWVVPFKRCVEARGERFNIYVSPSFFNGGSSGEVPTWLLHNPAEYAEYAISLLMRLKQVHGIIADYYCICNEAGNDNPFSPQVVARMIKVLGARLKIVGLPTRIQFPECINANTSWRYIQAVRDDAEVWRYIGAVTYHLYGKNDARPQIRNFAWAKGLPTGQTEFMRLRIDHLYDDLTLGGTSYWEIYGLAGPWSRNISIHPCKTTFTISPRLWTLSQVMRYVRPGAVRIGATSTDAQLRALAFMRNDKVTIVLINTKKPYRARTVTVKNLPPGRYGASQSVGGKPYRELGVRIVKSNRTLTITVPANAVLTIYPHTGENQPPTLTEWRARPPYLTLPANGVTLSASATDPELDSLSFTWSLKKHPAGAKVKLSNPNSPRTRATGLTVAGQYIFTITVSDGRHSVSRDAMLNVYASNQPPIPVDVHNRIPLMVTLPQNSTQLRGGGLDIEGDKLTFKWSIVKQPRGASAMLMAPNAPRCKVVNMTIAGDYVFKFDVSDGRHTASKLLTVTVYPPNHAPIIRSIVAKPSRLKRPTSSATLVARTSDPDGDVIAHWWSIKRKPTGARPVIVNPTAPITKVIGLTIAGTYTFTLTVVDRTKFTRKDVVVVVGG